MSGRGATGCAAGSEGRRGMRGWSEGGWVGECMALPAGIGLARKTLYTEQYTNKLHSFQGKKGGKREIGGIILTSPVISVISVITEIGEFMKLTPAKEK